MEIPDKIIEELNFTYKFNSILKKRLLENFIKETDAWYIEAMEQDKPPSLPSVYGSIKTISNLVVNGVLDHYMASNIFGELSKLGELDDKTLSKLPPHLFELLLEFAMKADKKSVVG